MRKPGIIFLSVIAFCFLLLLPSFFYSCSRLENKNKEEPIARVYDKYLYPSDIIDIFPINHLPRDSLLILKNFIDNWIKKQLILYKAELNLTEEQKDVNKQLEEYRSSLLIYKYEQNLIKQKLDTIITEEEIENYYTENSSNFILDKNIVKAVFIKLPFEAPNLNLIRQLYRSEKEEDFQQLESYCYQYAIKYDYFDDQWVDFENILQELPDDIRNPERYLRYNRTLEQQDSDSRYYVYIRDYKLVSEVAPLPYVNKNIKSIILNKRKLEFINDIENNIYQDALNKGSFTVY